jgi:hypothetical protein
VRIVEASTSDWLSGPIAAIAPNSAMAAQIAAEILLNVRLSCRVVSASSCGERKPGERSRAVPGDCVRIHRQEAPKPQMRVQAGARPGG